MSAYCFCEAKKRDRGHPVNPRYFISFFLGGGAGNGGVATHCHSIPCDRDVKPDGRVERYVCMLWRASMALPSTMSRTA